MEQGTSTTPNRISFQRATANAIWNQSGASGGVDLGVIDMHALDEGISREKIMFAIDGGVVLGYDEAVSVAPIYTIKGKQQHTQIQPLLRMGTLNADVVQNSASSQTFTIVGVVLGRIYDIGARNITLQFVKVGGVTKTPEVDYFLAANRGTIRFPENAAGIAAGATVVVTFDKPAIIRKSVTAFNQLNQNGTLQLFLMDSFTPSVPLEEATIPGSISRDKGSDGDPTKTDQWALRFAVTGHPTFLRRAA